MKSVGLQIAILVALQFGLVFSLTRCASDGEQGEVQEAVEQEQGQSASEEGTEQAAAESSDDQQSASEESTEGSSGLAAVEAPDAAEQPVGAEVEVEEQTEQEATSGAQDAVAESLVQAVESETAPMDTSVGQAIPETTYSAPVAQPEAAPAMESTFASTASADGGSGHAYIVQKGDSLSLIAKRIYGSLSKWRELAEFNGIRNPNRIFPGDSIRYPENSETAGFSSQYQNLARETIQVKQGDTLASIASTVYRDSGAWKALWRQNGSIDNPNRILVGQKLTFIPQDTLYQFMGTEPSRTSASAPRREPRSAAMKTAPVAEVKEPAQRAQPAAESAPAAPVAEPVAASAPSAPEPPAIPEPKQEPKTAAAPADSNTKPVLEESTDEADEMMKPNDNLEEVIDSDETE